MKILVTGAYGQLGSEISSLKDQFPDWEFLFTDFDTLDICNEKTIESFVEKNRPGFIINCAAYTAVDKAETDIESAELLNAVAPGYLAKYARKIGSKLIHISTDYVFDGAASTPYVETDPVNPRTAYGRTKLNGEKECFENNPETVVIRTSWLYSTYGNNFVKTMLKLSSDREKLSVVFDQAGSPTYAADLAGAILQIIAKAMDSPENFTPGIYHYSNEGVASWYDFAVAVFEISETRCKVLPVLSSEFQAVAIRPAYSVLNKSKIKNTFGLKVPYWRDSLKTCIQKIKS